MNIYDGNLSDISDFSAKRYLQINSCGVQDVKKDYTVIREKGRQDYHLLLIESGICHAEYDKKIYTLKMGDILFYPPGMKQWYTFPEPSVSLWCHFTGTAIEELLSEYGIFCGAISSASNGSAIETYYDMIRRFHQPSLCKLANSSLSELLFYISPSFKSEESNFEKHMSEILDYIHLNYSHQITVEALAKKSGYSASRFARIFKSEVGSTPIQYVNEIRLRTAAEMLFATLLPVGEIAQECGFCDPLYFSKRFKKKYSLSPADYRQKIKSRE